VTSLQGCELDRQERYSVCTQQGQLRVHRTVGPAASRSPSAPSVRTQLPSGTNRIVRHQPPYAANDADHGFAPSAAFCGPRKVSADLAHHSRQGTALPRPETKAETGSCPARFSRFVTLGRICSTADSEPARFASDLLRPEMNSRSHRLSAAPRVIGPKTGMLKIRLAMMACDTRWPGRSLLRDQDSRSPTGKGKDSVIPRMNLISSTQ